MQMRKGTAISAMPVNAVLEGNVRPQEGETAAQARIRKAQAHISGNRSTPLGAYGAEGTKLAQARKRGSQPKSILG